MNPAKTTERMFFLLALAVGLLLQFYPLFFSGFSQTIWDESDSRLVHYILEHGYQYLAGNPLHAHYLSPPFFAPHPGTLAYSELLIGALPIYTVFRIVLAPETAYQFWMLAIQILSFWSFYCFLTWAMGLKRMPSILGAFLFAFGRFKSAQLGHFQLCLQFYAIFSIACFIRGCTFGNAKQERHLTWAAYFFFALQLVTSFYHGWFMSLFLFIAGLIVLIRKPLREPALSYLKRTRWTQLGGLVIVALIMTPLMPALLSAKRELGPRAFEEVSTMLPRFASWIYMGSESFLYGWTAHWEMFRLPMQHEHRLACGLLTMLLLFWGTWKSLKASPSIAFKLLIGVTAFFFLWTLQISDYTLWRTLHFTFPGGRSIRAVSRIALWLWIPLIIGLVATLSRESQRWGKWILPMFILIAAEQSATSPSYRTLLPRERAEKIAVSIPKDCATFFYSPTVPAETSVSHLDAMWASTMANIPTINGYSGGYPRGWEELNNHQILTADDQPRLEFELKQWSNLKGIPYRPECWVKLDVLSPKQ